MSLNILEVRQAGSLLIADLIIQPVAPEPIFIPQMKIHLFDKKTEKELKNPKAFPQFQEKYVPDSDDITEIKKALAGNSVPAPFFSNLYGVRNFKMYLNLQRDIVAHWKEMSKSEKASAQDKGY